MIWTFLEAFAGAWLALGAKFSEDVWQAALIAGVIAVAKAIVSSRIGNKESASSAPSV